MVHRATALPDARADSIFVWRLGSLTPTPVVVRPVMTDRALAGSPPGGLVIGMPSAWSTPRCMMTVQEAAGSAGFHCMSAPYMPPSKYTHSVSACIPAAWLLG